MSFSNWLSQQNNIKFDYTPLKNSFLNAKKSYISSLHDTQMNVGSFNLERFFQKIESRTKNYPNQDKLLKALNSKNINYIWDQHRKFMDWSRQDNQLYSTVRDLNRDVWTYIDWIGKDNFNLEKSIHDLDNLIQEAVQKTELFLNKIKEEIEQAISRSDWKGSSITVQPIPPQENNLPTIEPSNWVYVYVGNSHHTFFNLGFDNGKIEIDEILEGDEEDVFESQQTKSDYFLLINELKTPGSTTKGKKLTLFTARPKSDREFYLKTKTLPVNIFLGNNFDNVEGISRDFEERDIWKVKINSRYLTQTLDGKIKHYQVTSPDAVVDSIELLT
jgi:hypothetical protein